MTKPLLLLFVLLPLSATSFAQQTLRGRLIDSDTHNRVRDASVSIRSRQKASFSRYSISDTAGSFVFSNIDSGVYDLLISYIGYRNFTQSIKLDSAETDIGILQLTRTTG
ncbi:MAG: carboxypeptidase regulatory-like domain-containing protein, partial [Chitinophagaceae bacterium]|nr:carboxypeptidase regulatory-like domain-containing protein [Chitinophagaceae bacterium]